MYLTDIGELIHILFKFHIIIIIIIFYVIVINVVYSFLIGANSPFH